jgi:hypothetical protein
VEKMGDLETTDATDAMDFPGVRDGKATVDVSAPLARRVLLARLASLAPLAP